MIMSMEPNEYWYGGYVHDGIKQPISARDDYTCDSRLNTSPNQLMPLFLSTKGRVMYQKEGFVVRFNKGTIELPDTVEVITGQKDLRGAYVYAMQHFFPFQSITLAEELFTQPVYNTWIELTFNQNQKDVLRYADGLLSSGLPAGVLMIDDGWSDYYGKWSFNQGKFPDAKRMIQTLNAKGFHVMLWICPYITPDTVEYRYLKDHDLLVKNPDETIFITEWWNGHSAVLDLTNPKTRHWLDQQLQQLKDLGVAGFKFDGGDSLYYREDNVTYRPVTPDEHSLLWAEFGSRFAFNEFRVTTHAGGLSLMQRLCDKDHDWGDTGIASLMPNSLLQGITGHPFCSPDMIGGGEYLNFLELESRA
ncbi:glycoside hydrolase family 31 protein [Halolactibacillus sp. JCM 19043]|uniref:glycoside hydrolase family 31 protein n=1 Tax=Halolactibacillus sp. JCM 19043 TaxID=1460638 RepID=UPI000A7E977F|nr:glycoside hydrolase family 31 protein [Halolactibacillus sp. JCM 19043]